MMPYECTELLPAADLERSAIGAQITENESNLFSQGL